MLLLQIAGGIVVAVMAMLCAFFVVGLIVAREQRRATSALIDEYRTKDPDVAKYIEEKQARGIFVQPEHVGDVERLVAMRREWRKAGGCAPS